MADDDNIDVEGEFDLKNELGDEFYDANELPSKSVNLLPEFTSPAWMLEQGWSLDSCIDEKSKATIEKMLLEEQQYKYGRKPYLDIKKNVLLVSAGTSKPNITNKSPWNQEEKNTFLKGMGIFGRSWSKIASLIPTRTSLQVKNYAQQYMKNLAKKKAEQEKREQESLKSFLETPLSSSNFSSLDATVASVTTGQPTVTVGSASASGVKQKSPSPKKKRTQVKQSNRNNTLLNLVKITGKLTNSKGTKGVKKRKRPDAVMMTGIMTLSDISGTEGATQEANLITNMKSFGKKFIRTEGSGSPFGESCSSNANCNGTDFTMAKDSMSSDEDVDIDIEGDDENVVLQTRSASPSSVYQQLLMSAQMKVPAEEEPLDAKKHNGYSLSPVPENNDACLKHDLEPSTPNDVVPGNVLLCSDVLQSNGEDEGRGVPDGESDVKTILKTVAEEDEWEDDENHLVKTEEETIVNGLISTSGEVVEFDIPQEEKILDPSVISDEEKHVHADFFDGRQSKTPERYLKIRSYILDCWKKCKPSYLNKTSVRPGLKNCGDVNCIGRIHSYLECVGAINFGCEQAMYKNPQKGLGAGAGANSRVKGISKELLAALPVTKSEMRPRKRRIRDDSGFWVDEKELEGKTIEHDLEIKKKEVNRKPKVPKAAKPVYDPFKLMPCMPFSEESKEPYGMEVFNTALAIMDIHAHISKTEVIGMLGGQFCPETNKLTISMAVPCKSMSTGMQCEMDPVSQTLASEQIEDVGMSVVGWYHSHPTFSPDPSVRDIETQQKFQYWFSKGGSHFVGVIISPYNVSSPSVYSDIRCLTISNSHNKEFLCNIPYKFDYQVVYRDNLREILGPASELAEKYSNYTNRVLLSYPYKTSLGITCLSKMLQSVKRLLVPVNTFDGMEGTSTSSLNHMDSGQSFANLPKSSLQLSSSSSLSSLSSSSSSSPSVNTTTKNKIDEVLHWLEQIFLEKCSQSSSGVDGLDGASADLSSEDLVQPLADS